MKSCITPTIVNCANSVNSGANPGGAEKVVFCNGSTSTYSFVANVSSQCITAYNLPSGYICSQIMTTNGQFYVSSQAATGSFPTGLCS